MTPDNLDALERLAREATSGPWFAECCHVGPSCWCRTVSNKAGSDDLDDCVVTAGGIGTKDADFIAAANPQAILQLIGRLRRAESMLRICRGFALKVRDEAGHPLMDTADQMVDALNEVLAPPQSTGGEAV